MKVFGKNALTLGFYLARVYIAFLMFIQHYVMHPIAIANHWLCLTHVFFLSFLKIIIAFIALAVAVANGEDDNVTQSKPTIRSVDGYVRILPLKCLTNVPCAGRPCFIFQFN